MAREGQGYPRWRRDMMMMIYIYIVQKEENSNIGKFSLLIYFARENCHTLRLIKLLYMFKLGLKKKTNMDYNLYVYEQK